MHTEQTGLKRGKTFNLKLKLYGLCKYNLCLSMLILLLPFFTYGSQQETKMHKLLGYMTNLCGQYGSDGHLEKRRLVQLELPLVCCFTSAEEHSELSFAVHGQQVRTICPEPL